MASAKDTRQDRSTAVKTHPKDVDQTSEKKENKTHIFLKKHARLQLSLSLFYKSFRFMRRKLFYLKLSVQFIDIYLWLFV